MAYILVVCNLELHAIFVFCTAAWLLFFVVLYQ